MKIVIYNVTNCIGRNTLYVTVLDEDNMKNYWLYNNIVDHYTEKLGNRYNAVYAIAKEARKRAEDNDNRISHSSALAWVITGDTPIQLLDPKYLPLTELEVLKKNTHDYVLNVGDEQVKVAVESSIDKSILNQYVVYDYGDILDSSRQARVRIIVNLIWDEVYIDRY